jgi:hypothetical protein
VRNKTFYILFTVGLKQQKVKCTAKTLLSRAAGAQQTGSLSFLSSFRFSGAKKSAKMVQKCAQQNFLHSLSLLV